MTQPLRALGRIAAAIAAAILITGSATAHSGEWGIFPDPAQSWPGAGLHIRGDLPSTGPIELVIVGPGPTTAQLGTIEDAPNGRFETTVTVPAGLAPGGWSVEARAAGMVTARGAGARGTTTASRGRRGGRALPQRGSTSVDRPGIRGFGGDRHDSRRGSTHDG